MAEYKDSEEIKRQLRIWVQECEDWLEHKEANCFRDCIDLIDQIPAADVRPVIHAKWEEGSGEWLPGTDATKDYKCSNCKSEFVEGGKYCPECGATMRKGER